MLARTAGDTTANGTNLGNSFTEDAGGGTARIHLFCVEDGAQYSGND